MKITKIEIYKYSIRMEPFTISRGTMEYADNVLVVVHTQSGFQGFGECSPFPSIVGETQATGIALAREMAPVWIGKNAMEIKNRMEELDHFCAKNYTIKSAFDMALYDLASQFEGVPLYHFLGGTPKAIRTDITIGIGPLDKMIQEGKRFVEKGAQEIKVKVGTDPELDIQRIRTLRQHIGNQVKIRIDANQGWSFSQAVHVLTALESEQVEFCEQPMHAIDDRLLPLLRSKTRVPIMGDESCYLAGDAVNLAESEACDMINIKLAKSGGILEALQIHEVAKKHQIPCMIGGMLESRLALTANLHLAYACDHIKFYDLDSPLLGLLEDPVVGGVTYTGYDLSLSDSPGLGATIDPEFLATCPKWNID